MKKYFLALSGFMTLSFLSAQTTFTVIDNAVFYDGYASLVSEPTPPDVFRLRNDLVTTKITETQLAQIGNQLSVNITISALCDNYDRIGSVNVVMAPKGSATYNTDAVSKIELGRFITPFMNKNISPTSVPYTFEVSNLCNILKSPELKSTFDFWLELEVFGVPYAANNEVAGCSGRNDVFKGKVEFVTNTPVNEYIHSTVVTPLSFKANFNDYQTGASDAKGTTKKTVSFTTTELLKDASFYLITSNHGANQGGEEYIRRLHKVTFDDVEQLTYVPGGKSCEPYRKYNTQANGIYGPSPRTEAQWLSFSNWCPGDVIPIRQIALGNLNPGVHTFVISVPDAVFNGDQGNFPFSLYLQGNKSGVGIADADSKAFQIFPNPVTDQISIQGATEGMTVQLLDPFGKEIESTNKSVLDVSNLATGVYFIRAKMQDGTVITRHFIKN